MRQHFLSIDDIDGPALTKLLDDADALKAARGPSDDLAGRSVAMIFEKPSTRTRVSFEVGIAELGGTPLVLGTGDLQLGRGETIEDTARVLSRYVHAIVIRTFGQDRLEALAGTATIPVVNALSDHEHPCQALADLQTIREHKGELAGVHLAYVGDGNNVAHSLLLAGGLAGMHVAVVTPPGYEPDEGVVARARMHADASGGSITITNDPAAAVEGADVVYTDVWASMGQEGEATARASVFAPYQVNDELLARAPGAIVLHCLPAHRGEEITESVLDGPSARVWDQAENRLHAQKALLRWLLA